MRDLRSWILASAALFAWVLPAAAVEKNKPVPEGGAVQIVLLRHQSVRDDLKLTADEAKKIDDFTEEQWKKARRAEDLGQQESDSLFADLTRENDRFLMQTLTPDQRKRLDQITLQLAGLLWVTRPRIASQLNLTEDQKTKVAQYQKEARAEMEDLLHSTTRRDRSARLRELRTTSRKRLMDVLTDEQEKKWKEMAGEPFRGDLRFDEAAATKSSEK